MRVGQAVRPEALLGIKTRKLRLLLKLTQQELSDLTGVSIEEISRFECCLPVCLDTRRRILKELWGAKTRMVTIDAVFRFHLNTEQE